MSYQKFSEVARQSKLLELLKSGQNIALISDAGMPVISDPGALLVQAAWREKIRIEVVPGPTALINALVLSGLPAERFCFEGFLDSKPGRRQEQLRNLIVEERTMIFYEAPHRLVEMLADVLAILGDRTCFVCRELTKKYEEHLPGKVSEILAHFEKQEPRGEFVVVLAGLTGKQIKTESAEQQKLKDLLLAKKLSKKDVAEILSELYGLSKNVLKKEFYC